MKLIWQKPKDEDREKLHSLFASNLMKSMSTGSIDKFARFIEPISTDGVSSALLRMVVESGIPKAEGAESPIEEAIFLLKIAAQLEQALLVEYLYAAWSIDKVSADAFARVREVAIQEMGHLITVQNMLLFVGAKPWFMRQDFDPQPDIDPFSFSLEPFTKCTLEKFLITEMPDPGSLTLEQQATIADIRNRKSTALHETLHRVGLLYAKLYWLFQPNDETPVGGWNLSAISDLSLLEKGWHVADFPGQNSVDTLQADPDESEWRYQYGHGGVFRKIGSREEILQSILSVAAQGEGLVATDTQSHFNIFYSIYEEYDSAGIKLLPLPANPTIGLIASADPIIEINRITNPLARTLCVLFDKRYKIMLVALTAGLSCDRVNNSALRKKYVRWGLEEMTVAVRPLSGLLIKQPGKEGGLASQFTAAPTFDIGTQPFPTELQELETLLTQLHKESAILIATIMADTNDFLILDALNNIHDNDSIRFP